MAIKTTRWHPDTCSCIVEYQWDSDLPVEQRTHTPSATIRECEFHQNLSVVDHFTAVQAENQGKNIAIGKTKAAFPDVPVTWVLDVARSLSITLVSDVPLDTRGLQLQLGSDIQVVVVDSNEVVIGGGGVIDVP